MDRSHAERREFDLREATEQIVASVRPVLRKTTVTVDIDMPEGLMIESYPGAYGQVLTNLILNASTHAFGDGQSGTIRIAAKPRGETDIELTFSDDGAGMTPEIQRKAFDPFFTTRRNKGGTGLGLHIVYTLVTQQLAGRLVLDSKPGKGTTFRIVLPRAARGTVATGVDRSESKQWPTRKISST